MSDSPGFSMESITGSKSTLVVLAGSVIVLLGSFLTWVTVSAGGQSVSFGGMAEGGDGVITLIVAIATGAVAVLLKNKARMISVTVGAGIILLTAIIDVLDITGDNEFDLDVSVGLGLWMVLVGGAVAAVGAFLKD